jgi:hypothetical protein
MYSEMKQRLFKSVSFSFFLSFFLCLGVCSSLFRSARYVLPRSLSVCTVNYKRSFATCDHIILNSVTECRGSPNHVCACFLHFCQNDDVNRIAAICWRTLQVTMQDEELVESGVLEFRIDVLPKLAGNARSVV